MFELIGHARRVLALAYSLDGRLLVSGGSDDWLCTWETATGDLINRRALGISFVYDLAFDPKGRWLAMAEGWSLRAIPSEFATEPPSEQSFPRFANPSDGVRALAFASDGRSLATIGHRATFRTAVYHWDTPDAGEPWIRGSPWLTETHRPRNDLLSISFAPDNRALAFSTTGGDAVLYHWARREDGVQSRVLPIADDLVASRVVFSPDGETLAVVTGKRVLIWDFSHPPSRNCATTFRIDLEGHERVIRSADFSPDGRLLATSSLDGTVRLWDPYRGEELTRLDPSVGPLYRVAFAPDGQTLAVAGHRGNIFIFDVDASH